MSEDNFLQASEWTLRKQDAYRGYINTYGAIAAAIQRKYSNIGYHETANCRKMGAAHPG
jgi:hypothetical protein